MRGSRSFILGLLLAVLAVLAMLAVPVVRAQLEQWQALDLFDLRGGLNTTADTTAVAPNEAADIQNMVLDVSGSVSTREGFTRLTTSAFGSSATATGLAFYKQSGGNRYVVGTLSNGLTDSIRKQDYGGNGLPDGIWDDITPATGVSFPDDTLADFATVQDVLVIEDGVSTTAPVQWTGSGVATAISGSPNASMVEFHKRILWFAGRWDARSRVDFSNLDAYNTYTTTDFILVETDDGQVITGLKSALDCLYVFKTESIWRICGSDRDNLNLEQMVRGIGAASNQSIALINNKFIFQTSQGNFVIYDGGITVQLLSGKIQGTLDALNQDRIAKTVAVAFDDSTGDDDYYACVSDSGSGTHNRVLLFDTYHQAWTKFVGLACNAMAVIEVGTARKAIAFADYIGHLNRYPDGETDAGSIIQAFYQSGDLRVSQVPTQKTFREFQVFMRGEGEGRIAGFRWQVDFGGTTASDTVDLSLAGARWDTAVYDTSAYSDEATVIDLVHVNTVGDFINWRMEANEASSQVRLRGVRLWLEPSGRMGESQ